MVGLIDAEPLSEGELRLGLPLKVRTDQLAVWRDLGVRNPSGAPRLSVSVAAGRAVITTA
jgi:hypothetical protein